MPLADFLHAQGQNGKLITSTLIQTYNYLNVYIRTYIVITTLNAC